MKAVNEKELWEKCVAFHGHECGGLMTGYKAALYAVSLLNLDFSEDEEVVCISENDTCAVDAVQVILGCTAGKGNLLFHMTGKMAFSFYDRSSGKSVRLLAKEPPKTMDRGEKFAYLQSRNPGELFDAMDVRLPVPERAQIFGSCRCEKCGEKTAEKWIRLQNGKKLCLDCCQKYDRFHV